jgi:hypothetical protein
MDPLITIEYSLIDYWRGLQPEQQVASAPSVFAALASIEEVRNHVPSPPAEPMRHPFPVNVATSAGPAGKR